MIIIFVYLLFLNTDNYKRKSKTIKILLDYLIIFFKTDIRVYGNIMNIIFKIDIFQMI